MYFSWFPKGPTSITVKSQVIWLPVLIRAAFGSTAQLLQKGAGTVVSNCDEIVHLNDGICNNSTLFANSLNSELNSWPIFDPYLKGTWTSSACGVLQQTRDSELFDNRVLCPTSITLILQWRARSEIEDLRSSRASLEFASATTPHHPPCSSLLLQRQARFKVFMAISSRSYPDDYSSCEDNAGKCLTGSGCLKLSLKSL